MRPYKTIKPNSKVLGESTSTQAAGERACTHPNRPFQGDVLENNGGHGVGSPHGDNGRSGGGSSAASSKVLGVSLPPQAAGERACTPLNRPLRGDQAEDNGGNGVPEAVGTFNPTFGYLGTKENLQLFFKSGKKRNEDYVTELEERHNYKFPAHIRNKVIDSVKKCRSKLKTKAKENSRHAGRVKGLSEIFTVTFSLAEAAIPLAGSRRCVGRPLVEYYDAAPSTKRLKLAKAVRDASQVPAAELIMGVLKHSDIPHKNQLINIYKYCMVSPAKAKRTVNTLARPAPRCYTTEEALGLILDEGLTERQYINIRKGAQDRGFNIYPTYDSVLKAKDILRPEYTAMQFSEQRAKVALQSLLEHTCSRIFEMQDEVFHRIMNISEGDFTFYGSWGFDGSSGQSNYKQRYTAAVAGPHDDSSIFATTMIPLLITHNAASHVLWRNTVPQSIRFCRPIELHFVKESTELILEKWRSMRDEINSLLPFSIPHQEKKIKINFELSMTIIDGKVLNAITGTKSSMSCPICGKNPRNFNQLHEKFTPLETDRLKHGLSPLHALIRVFEMLLHISYRLDVKSWQARGPEQKTNAANRKQYIQAELFQRLGLRVDYASASGSGNSNNGNTARRAFAECEELAEILSIDKTLVFRLKIILLLINQPFPIDPDKFTEYCSVTAEVYVEKYPWYYMCPTLHKILIHGGDIIRRSVLPIGMYSEQAGESKNKTYKMDRAAHARKTSREVNLRDTFLRSMDASDPVLSTECTFARQPKSRKVLPPEAIDLLLCPEVHPVSAAPSMELLGSVEECDEDSLDPMLLLSNYEGEEIPIPH